MPSIVSELMSTPVMREARFRLVPEVRDRIVILNFMFVAISSSSIRVKRSPIYVVQYVFFLNKTEKHKSQGENIHILYLPMCRLSWYTIADKVPADTGYEHALGTYRKLEAMHTSQADVHLFGYAYR